jgi:hypothetical protein
MRKRNDKWADEIKKSQAPTAATRAVLQATYLAQQTKKKEHKRGERREKPTTLCEFNRKTLCEPVLKPRGSSADDGDLTGRLKIVARQ